MDTDTMTGTPNFAPLIDVKNMELSRLLDTDNQALNRCVKRLVESIDDPDGIISAFQSFAV